MPGTDFPVFFLCTEVKMEPASHTKRKEIISRRKFLKIAFAGGAVSAAALAGKYLLEQDKYQAATFIAAVKGYDDHLKRHMLS